MNNDIPQIVVQSARFCNMRTVDFLHKPWSYQHECMLEAVSANACGLSQAQYSTLSAAEAMKCCLKAGQWPAACSQLTGAETASVLPSLPARDPSIAPKAAPSMGVPKFFPEPRWATHDRPLVQSRAAYAASRPPSFAPSSATAAYGLGFLALLVVLGVLVRRRRGTR